MLGRCLSNIGELLFYYVFHYCAGLTSLYLGRARGRLPEWEGKAKGEGNSETRTKIKVV